MISTVVRPIRVYPFDLFCSGIQFSLLYLLLYLYLYVLGDDALIS